MYKIFLYFIYIALLETKLLLNVLPLLQMTEAAPGKLKASEFHLSWNNYEASLASFLRVLTSAKEGEEALYDVTISCSGGKLFQVYF